MKYMPHIPKKGRGAASVAPTLYFCACLMYLIFFQISFDLLEYIQVSLFYFDSFLIISLGGICALILFDYLFDSVLGFCRINKSALYR